MRKILLGFALMSAVSTAAMLTPSAVQAQGQPIRIGILVASRAPSPPAAPTASAMSSWRSSR